MVEPATPKVLATIVKQPWGSWSSCIKPWIMETALPRCFSVNSFLFGLGGVFGMAGSTIFPAVPNLRYFEVVVLKLGTALGIGSTGSGVEHIYLCRYIHLIVFIRVV